MDKILYKKLHPRARVPQRATEGAAGYDLSACLDEPLVLHPGQRERVPTGIALFIGEAGWGGFIFARSGLGTKFGISLPNGVGVVDSDYTGEILVALVNLSDRDYTVRDGDRIAQLVFLPVAVPLFEPADAFPDTARGEAGFGSTGLTGITGTAES